MESYQSFASKSNKRESKGNSATLLRESASLILLNVADELGRGPSQRGQAHCISSHQRPE